MPWRARAGNGCRHNLTWPLCRRRAVARRLQELWILSKWANTPAVAYVGCMLMLVAHIALCYHVRAVTLHNREHIDWNDWRLVHVRRGRSATAVAVCAPSPSIMTGPC